MVYYYLDIETFGHGERPDPEQDEIITIVFCAVDPRTGKKLQEPTLLKAWESSEEEIVKQLHERFGKHVFDFIPLGFNVLFDFWFLKHKFKKYCEVDLGDEFYLDRPFLDLKQVMVFRNKGRFKGVRLGPPGNPVHDWYEYKDYDSIERHVMDKLGKFLEEYRKWQDK